MFLPRLIAALMLAVPLAAHGHEFWIEPTSYQVDAGKKLQAQFKNGENFKGNSLSFFERSSTRFDMIAEGKVIAVTPRSGDSPAFDVPAPLTDGLVTVVHETSASRLTYREWAKFEKFVTHKDFATALEDHRAAGWSQEKFRERYTRHAKALIAIGAGEGTDVEAGLKTEFVALTNPYASTFDQKMKVALFLDGTPRADAQVEVFARAPDDTVEITLHRTDAKGHATIPVQRGYDYLFDAVVLAPAPDATTEENAIVWETYWAALTFSVPQ